MSPTWSIRAGRSATTAAYSCRTAWRTARSRSRSCRSRNSSRRWRDRSAERRDILIGGRFRRGGRAIHQRPRQPIKPPGRPDEQDRADRERPWHIPVADERQRERRLLSRPIDEARERNAPQALADDHARRDEHAHPPREFGACAAPVGPAVVEPAQDRPDRYRQDRRHAEIDADPDRKRGQAQANLIFVCLVFFVVVLVF